MDKNEILVGILKKHYAHARSSMTTDQYRTRSTIEGTVVLTTQEAIALTLMLDEMRGVEDD